MDEIKPVFEYPDGITPVSQEDVMQVFRDGEPLFSGSRFYTHDTRTGKKIGPPSLPILTYGQVWHVGWDIPTNYAIDAKLRCYQNNAHGFPMGQCFKKDLLALVSKSSEDLKRVRNVLGIAVKEETCPHCKGTGKVVLK